MKHKFGSIGAFAQMYNYRSDMIGPTLTYVLKPKLHGSNVSVLITTDGIQYRSKNRVLQIDDDHMGFANAMSKYEDRWEDMLEDNIFNPVLVMGEWAGPGVQKSDAVSMIPEKTFFVFAIYYPETGDEFSHVVSKHLDIDTTYFADISNVREIPVIHEFDLSFSQTDMVLHHVAKINEIVEEFETVDPYIKKVYDIEGTGEGVVGTLSFAVSLEEYFDYAFKAKTEAHRTKATSAPAAAKEPLPQEALEFAETFVTLPRMKQCIHELGIEVPDMKFTQQVMNWMKADVWKESEQEVEEMGVETKALEKVLGHKIVALWKGIVNGKVDA